jgi:CRISPR-associated protein Cas6
MSESNDQQVVDIAFRIRGAALPLDHGYVLFAALARCLERFRTETRWGVHPVLGARKGPGVLALTPQSRLKIRLPANDIVRLLPLAGAELDVDGNRINVDVPEILPVKPAAALKSRFVTVKGFVDPEPFTLALRRQLAAMDLGQDAERVELVVGAKRVMRVGPHTIVGFPVGVTGLDAHASVAIQARGLGGRRHMGAGVFVPVARRTRPVVTETLRGA